MFFGFVFLLIGQFFGNTVVPIGTKIAAPLTGPILFVFFRFLICSIIMCIIFLVTGKRKITLSVLRETAPLGFLLMINVVLFTVAIAFTNVIMSTLIYSITPLFVGIQSHFILNERFDGQKLLGLIVAFIGLLFLLSQSVLGLHSNIFGEPIGNIIILFSMLGYSYYIVYSRKILHKKAADAIQTSFVTFLFTMIFILIILITLLLTGHISIKPIPKTGIEGIIIVGIGTVMQYLFLQIGIKSTDAFTASIFQYTGPFMAAAVTIPFQHQQISSALVIGGLLILLGVFIATSLNYFKIPHKRDA